MLGVDLTNFPKFPRVDDDVTYAKGALDIRDQLDVDSGAELPDYSGPYRADLRYTDFSVEALATTFLPWAEAYREACIDAWSAEVGDRYGAEVAAEIEWTAWNDQIRPELERMAGEFLPAGHALRGSEPARPPGGPGRYPGRVHGPLHPGSRRRRALQVRAGHLAARQPRVPAPVHRGLGRPDRRPLRPRLHVRHPVGIWGDTVLPMAKRLKTEYLGITGDTVADWMKDLQVDATAMPGKAFDVSFEMPEPDVGIMTFNRCVAADQWETMGRPDILEKNCHSTCPKSMIETTRMYNPNMKVDILAIPPRKDPGDVCCKWRFSMRDEADPEYVPVTLTTKPDPLRP